jgi:ABC-type branched-subunit amino acid transport system permease subunit
MTFLVTGRGHFLALALLVVGCVVAVFTLNDSYYLLVLSLIAIWAVLGLSWNILGGYGGLISFGHAAFFGCGATALPFSSTTMASRRGSGRW